MAASTTHPMPITARWPVETSDLATQPPRLPSTGSRLADSQDGPPCLAALLLADRGNASDPASLSQGSFRSAHVLHHLLFSDLIRYHYSWDTPFLATISFIARIIPAFSFLGNPLPY